MTPLQEKITRLVTLKGPISISEYMMMALADPDHGYYRTAEPFGREGDFITAPETSQMFGEMIAIWALATWRGMGSPAPFLLCEIGPGRGTLMDDVLRTIGKLAPECLACARVNLIETSPRLIAVQKEKLGSCGAEVHWIENVGELAGLPLVLIANELFDALPIHQYVMNNGSLHERTVAVDQNGRLFFSHAPRQESPSLPADPAGNVPDGLIPDGIIPDSTVPDGTILEFSPARLALTGKISTHLAARRGAALIIDYGALQPGSGDTLQAISKHRFCPPLENPGTCDLTSHVDFAALARAACRSGCHTAAMTQGAFLIGLGLLERAGRLGADRDDAFRSRITADVGRLAAPDQMGELFKVLCIADTRTCMPPFPWEKPARDIR